jgi:hypothetical protein
MARLTSRVEYQTTKLFRFFTGVQPTRTRIIPLQSDEKARIQRAFYRSKFLRTLDDSKHSNSSKDVVLDSFLRSLSVWELEELACSHLDLQERRSSFVNYIYNRANSNLVSTTQLQAMEVDIDGPSFGWLLACQEHIRSQCPENATVWASYCWEWGYAFWSKARFESAPHMIADLVLAARSYAEKAARMYVPDSLYDQEPNNINS